MNRRRARKGPPFGFSPTASGEPKMLRFISKLRTCTSGATAVEYGLIAGLISVVIIAAITITGNELIYVFARVSGALHSVAPAP